MNKKVIVVIIGALLLFAAIFLVVKVASLVLAPKEAPVTSEIDKASGEKLLETAQKFIADGELLKAKNAYVRIMEKFPNSVDAQKVQEALDDINIKILFSPIITKDSLAYEVQQGDSLTKIAKKFNTTIELIAKTNNLKDSSLRIGKKLKISKAKFSILVDKSQNILTLRSDKDILKTYRIAIGKNNSTPVGNFKIVTRIVDPPWYPSTGGVIPSGDLKNVLGTRWLGLSKPSYGIHGTTQPDSIGKSVTEGCVRLKNPDVEELYTIVPEGTEVIITD